MQFSCHWGYYNGRIKKILSHIVIIFTVYFFVFIIFRIQLFRAFRADAVAELGLGVAADIPLDLVPVPLVVTNFFAGSAYGQQAAQCPDLGKGILQFLDKLPPALLCLFAF